MPGIPFGALAEGVSGGLGQGQQMRARQIAIQDELRQRAAQEAASNWLQQIGSQPDAAAPMPAPTPQPAVPPQGPMPGAAPPVAAGPPQQVPMPGAMPMAAPPQGAPPAAGPPMAPSGASPAAGPPAAPPGGPAVGGQPPPNPNLSGTAAPTGDVFADAKKTIQSISKGLLQANPGRKWKPGEFMDAVNQSIKVMEGVNPLEKIAAQAQIAGAKAQYEYWHANQVHEDKAASLEERTSKDVSAHEDRQAKIQADLKRAKMTSDSREKIAALSSATRLQAAEIAQAGANERTDKTLGFRQQALEAGLDEKTWQTQMTAALKEEGLSDAYVSKLFSAQSAAGQSPAVPQRPLKQPLPKPPARGGAAPAAAGGAKPIPASTMQQWAQVPAANKAAAKKHLADQGYDVSGLR